MVPVDSSIGKKIRYFRQRAGLSQFDLENRIGAAIGSISRIENDQTNPTKETLKTLSEILTLTEAEKLDLFDLVSLFPSEVEITQAINESAEYLKNPGRLAYLIDEWANIYALSAGFINLLEINEQSLRKIIRKNLFEIFFDPQYGIRGVIDERSFEKAMSVELARMNAEANLEELPRFHHLMSLSSFPEIYENSKLVPRSDVLSPENKKVKLNLKKQTLELIFTREMLKTNSRFEIIEYIPANI